MLGRDCERVGQGFLTLAVKRDQTLDILRVYNLHELLSSRFFLVAAVLELEVRFVNDLKCVIRDYKGDRVLVNLMPATTYF